MSTALVSLTNKLAAKFGMENEGGLLDVLKATAFKGQVSDAQMTALMVVANQYGLNPFTKEIFAFPDKNNGIVPVVGVDGWSRIINDHAQFDGLEFDQDDKSCTCIIFRKDRTHPIKVTEYKDECSRNTQPWQSHPKRMMRHKALIQCARLAFGYSGIYDQDEAERIVESGERVVGSGSTIDAATGEIITKREEPKVLPNYTNEAFAKNFDTWVDLIRAGTKTADSIIATISSKAVLSEDQKIAIRDAQAEVDANE
jgi:phage recombination protein Bet